jgi:hypothetical protein
VPAAAVIPAPIAYIKVVAVKKLVVAFLGGAARPAALPLRMQSPPPILAESVPGISLLGTGPASFTVKKLECLKQAFLL